MLAHAVCCDSVGPQLGFQGGFFLFVCFTIFHKIITVCLAPLYKLQRSALWWSIASCQDAGLGKAAWAGFPQPPTLRQVSCAVNSLHG